MKKLLWVLIVPVAWVLFFVIQEVREYYWTRYGKLPMGK